MPTLPKTDLIDPKSSSDNSIRHVITSRPVGERLKEYKYRCAQAIVFGLPVLGLQWMGRSLGGSPQESQRWVGLLQALLTGWVVYVSATGMLVEGLALLPNRVTADLPVAGVSAAAYLFGAISVSGIFFRGHPLYGPILFHWIVLLLAVWTGLRWLSLARAMS